MKPTYFDALPIVNEGKITKAVSSTPYTLSITERLPFVMGFHNFPRKGGFDVGRRKILADAMLIIHLYSVILQCRWVNYNTSFTI